MKRTGTLCAVLLTMLLFTGAADGRARAGCHVGHAKILLRRRALVAYSRVTNGDRYVYACAWRTGRARTIGSISNLSTQTSDTTIRAHAMVHLVVDTAFDDQYTHEARTTWWNIATARKRTLYATDAPIAGPVRTTGVPLDRMLLTSDGCTVLAHSADHTANIATVRTAPFSGPWTELDRSTADAIPGSSLSLAHHTATWATSRQPRRADLPRTTC